MILKNQIRLYTKNPISKKRKKKHESAGKTHRKTEEKKIRFSWNNTTRIYTEKGKSKIRFVTESVTKVQPSTAVLSKITYQTSIISLHF